MDQGTSNQDIPAQKSLEWIASALTDFARTMPASIRQAFVPFAQAQIQQVGLALLPVASAAQVMPAGVFPFGAPVDPMHPFTPAGDWGSTESGDTQAVTDYDAAGPTALD